MKHLWLPLFWITNFAMTFLGIKGLGHIYIIGFLKKCFIDCIPSHRYPWEFNLKKIKDECFSAYWLECMYQFYFYGMGSLDWITMKPSVFSSQNML